MIGLKSEMYNKLEDCLKHKTDTAANSGNFKMVTIKSK